MAFIADAKTNLSAAGINCEIFSDVSPNPVDLEIATGAEVFRSGGHDSVVAIGGGSGMDAGKAISLIADSGHDLWRFDFDHQPIALGGDQNFPPLICVPTTAGTGAETESTAMVTDTKREMKGCVWHPLQKPIAVILDPEVTIGLPANLTAWTGCDALVHAIEAYCVPALHPLCDAIALEGLALVYQNLPIAVSSPENLQARGGLLTGSCMAGIAFLKGLGLVHAISHMVGAECDTHHGLTNAVVLPAVLRFNASAISHKIGPMCQAMSLSSDDFETFYDAVTGLLDSLGIPENLAELGVKKNQVSSIAEKAFLDAARSTNPVPSDTKQIESLISEILIRAR